MEAHENPSFPPPIEGVTYPFRIGDLVTAANGNLARVYAYSSSTLNDGHTFPVIIFQDPTDLTTSEEICDEEWHLWETHDVYKTAEEFAKTVAREDALRKYHRHPDATERKANFMEQLPRGDDWDRIEGHELFTYEQFRAFNDKQYDRRSYERQIIDNTIYVHHCHRVAVMDLESGCEMPFYTVFFNPVTDSLVFSCNR